MSQSNAQKRINLLSQKYKRYCQKFRGNQRWKGWQLLEDVVCKSYACWQKLTPVSMRGWASQYQQFNYLWKSEIGKECSNSLISSKSIQQCFINEQKKTVLGLLYTKQSLKKVIAFLNTVSLQMTSQQFLFCPINIQTEYFQNCFEDKVGYYDESIIILWKGLFNQIILLGRLKTCESSLKQEIEKLIDQRSKYQSKIKQKAFLSQNNSSIETPT